MTLLKRDFLQTNKAADGAGVYASGVASFSFSNVTFSSNVAYRGGAAYLALGIQPIKLGNYITNVVPQLAA